MQQLNSPPFDRWLEQRLDAAGLDGAIHARWVMQICREPHAFITPDDSGWLCDARSGSPELKLALSQSFSNVGLVKDELEELIGDISQRLEVQQFSCLATVTNQNDSVDSGVCPSPEGSDQNYDEAFPPLSDDLEPTPPAVPSPIPLPCAPKPQEVPKPYFTPCVFVSEPKPCVSDRQFQSCPSDILYSASGTPHFVLAKCSHATASAKVGSCPTRLEFGYSGGPLPSGDLCSQEGCFQEDRFVLQTEDSNELDESMDSCCTTEFCMPKVTQQHVLITPSPNNKRVTAVPGLNVPISPETHFVPIKCENMLGAFEPPAAYVPDLQDLYAMDAWAQEEYFVLKEQQLHQESQPAFALKFKADRPVKLCQTAEGEQMDSTWITDIGTPLSPLREPCAPLHMGAVWSPLDLSSPPSSTGCPESDWPLMSPGLAYSLGSVWEPQQQRDLGKGISDWQMSADDWMPPVPPPPKEEFDAAEDEDTLLLQYVNNINLISPLQSSL